MGSRDALRWEASASVAKKYLKGCVWQLEFHLRPAKRLFVHTAFSWLPSPVFLFPFICSFFTRYTYKSSERESKTYASVFVRVTIAKRPALSRSVNEWLLRLWRIGNLEKACVHSANDKFIHKNTGPCSTVNESVAFVPSREGGFTTYYSEMVVSFL